MCSWFLKSTTSMKVITPFSWRWRGVVANAARLEEAAGRLLAAFFDGPEFASAADLRFMSARGRRRGGRGARRAAAGDRRRHRRLEPFESRRAAVASSAPVISMAASGYTGAVALLLVRRRARATFGRPSGGR